MAIEVIEQNVKSTNYQMCNFSLILMDFDMPILFGYEATTRIREFLHMHKLKQPIITGVTGHTQQKFTDLAFNSGMNMVLSKPANYEILKDVLITLKMVTCKFKKEVIEIK